MARSRKAPAIATTALPIMDTIPAGVSSSGNPCEVTVGLDLCSAVGDGVAVISGWAGVASG